MCVVTTARTPPFKAQWLLAAGQLSGFWRTVHRSCFRGKSFQKGPVKLLVETLLYGTYWGKDQDTTSRPRHRTQPVALDQASMCFGIKAI